MLKSIKGRQPRMRLYSANVDGTGTAAIGGLDKFRLTLTDNGVGDYTLTFDSPFSATDYQVFVSPSTANIMARVGTKTISTVNILTRSAAVTAAVKAVATINTTTPIVLTASNFGDERNGDLITLDIAAAAANPGATILAVWGGTQSAATLTITPNDGTNNGAVAVNLTSAELVEYINTGAVVGKTITATDLVNFRRLVTATGGGAAVLANGGEGDNLGSKSFSGGVDASSSAAAADADFDVLIIGTDSLSRY